MAKSKLEQIKSKSSENPNGYLTYTDAKSKTDIFKTYGNVIDSFDTISSNKVVAKTDFAEGASSNTELRSPYWPGTYERLRPWDSIPMRFRDIVLACRQVYVRVGIVRNVIDLMTDFACEDLRMVHPDRKIETFFKVWKTKANINDAVSEFARHLLLDANVVVKRYTAILTKPVEKQLMEKTIAADIKLNVQYQDLANREIPWKYRFLNIAALEWIGGQSSSAYDQRQLGFKISDTLIKSINNPGTDPFSLRLAKELPEEIKKGLKSTQNGIIPLDMKNIYVSHNKKDSWEDWAAPSLYSILGDIKFKEKLRHAEMAALDGVINVIRIWKLGDHTKDILPDQAAITRLVSLLQNNTGGGTIDLIWDSMLTMDATYPPIDKILGADKYQQVNSDILIGLGIPEVLLGAGGGAKFSNSFIQLKTLIEKLKYIRSKITDWLNGEINLVCNSMGFKSAPRVSFGEMNLDDANITKKLIIGLFDRGIISAEAVLQVYGEDFLIETERIKEEQEVFKDNDIEIKGPFDQADPTQGQPGQGRPPGGVDTTKRDQRTPKPRTASLELSVLGMDAIDSIEENIIPIYLEDLGISNARKLTNQQKEDIDILRLIILSCINDKTDISKASLLVLSENSKNYNLKLYNQMRGELDNWISKSKKNASLEQKKRIFALSWAKFYSENI